MTKQTYVKEVQDVINEGLTEEVAVQAYQVLVERFDRLLSDPETEDFRANLTHMHKHERRYLRDCIDQWLAEFPLPIELTWRQVKFVPKRVSRCEVCGDYYYDASRNGKKVTCYSGGYCEHEYEVRRKRPGTVIDPIYKRRVNEVSTDMQPSNDDAVGNAKLTEMEQAAWREGQAYAVPDEEMFDKMR